MIEVNKELRMQAIEQAAEEAAEQKTAGNQPGQGPAGQGEGGKAKARGQREGRPQGHSRPRIPHDAGHCQDLHVPRTPRLARQVGPPAFRPTIRVEGKYVAFSTSADSARAGLEAIRKKGWKPSAEVEQALAHLPSPLSLLMLSDPRKPCRRCWPACRARSRRRLTP